MTADEILAALRRARTEDECMTLIRAGERRMSEIRARLAQIARPALAALAPPERAEAMRKGLAAVEALDREEEQLRRELDFLDPYVLGECDRRRGQLEAERLRREIPQAVRKLPGAITRVREQLAALDDAIAALNALADTIRRHEDAGLPWPDALDDEALAQLYQLRLDVWQRRDVFALGKHLLLREPQRFARSFDLCYERRGGKYDPTIRERTPYPVHPLDVGEPIYASWAE